MSCVYVGTREHVKCWPLDSAQYHGAIERREVSALRATLGVTVGLIPVTLGPRGGDVAWQGLSADAEDGQVQISAKTCTVDFSCRTCGFTVIRKTIRCASGSVRAVIEGKMIVRVFDRLQLSRDVGSLKMIL